MKHGETYTSTLHTHVHFDVYEPKVVLRTKAVILIHHDIGENASRYENFAEYLLNQGFVVIVSDIAGHGRSLIDFEQGYFGTEKALEHLMADMHHLQNVIMQRYPDSPFFMMGAGLGDLLVRKYASIYGDYIQGVLLLSPIRKVSYRFERQLRLTFLKALKGARYHPVGHIMKFRKKLSKGLGGHTYDWMTHDEKVKERIANDAMTNFSYTVQGYQDLLRIIKEVNSFDTIMKTPTYLSMFLGAGDEDPLTHHGADAKAITIEYKNHGVRDLTLKMYKERRHALLFDKDKKEVYQDIVAWLNERTYL